MKENLSGFESEMAVYIEAALGKKAVNPVALDLRSLTSIADLFIILSGSSNRQVLAISDFIVAELKKKGKRPLSMEGMEQGLWVLLDFGDVVYHVFYEPVRELYDLEGLWADAKRLDITGFGINQRKDRK